MQDCPKDTNGRTSKPFDSRHDQSQLRVLKKYYGTQKSLAVGAHPDDVDFGCGATIAKWVAAGCEATIVVCTDGSKGTWDAEASDAELVAERQAEQLESAKQLGVANVEFLGYVDGEMVADLEARAKLAQIIRKYEPNVVLGHDPWKPYRLHPDHRLAGQLTTDAVVAARDPKFFQTQPYAHHRPDFLMLWEAGWPDHVEDVSGFSETKYRALMAHKSQHQSTMHINDRNDSGDDTSSHTSFADQVDQKLYEVGRAANLKHAEAFKLIDDL